MRGETLFKKACSVLVAAALLQIPLAGMEPTAAFADEEAPAALTEAGDGAGAPDSPGDRAEAGDAAAEQQEPEASGEPAAQEEAAEAPVPGADAPVSPTNEDTHIDASLEDFLTPQEIEDATMRLFSRSLGRSGKTFADVLVYAERYLGVPYVWGGKDYNYNEKGGFDCSGYVCAVFNDVCGAGIKSGWTNAEGLFNLCTEISEGEARPGDIVFFRGTYGDNPNYISHVGIYCGNGVMINAGDPIGYDRVTDVKNVSGGTAARVYGRLMDLSGTSIPLSLARVQVGDQLYTGSPLTPEPVVIAAGSVLTKDRDYTLSYHNNTALGTATVTVAGKGAYHGTTSKSFKIYQNTLPDGTYAIAPSLGGATRVDSGLWGSSAVTLKGASASDTQAFNLKKQANGYYVIENCYTGNVLGTSQGLDLADGAAVSQQGRVSGAKWQEWCLEQNASGHYAIASALDSSLVLDAFGGSTASGTKLIVWSDSGAYNQRWSLAKTTSKREKLDALAAQNAQTLPDGSYFVSSAMRGSAVLDVQYASGADEAPVILWSNQQGWNQVWQVSHDAKGYVTLVNANSGKALDVRFAVPENGSDVIQYASQGSAYNQKWIAVKDGGGVKLVSAMAGGQDLVLDAYGASSADGTKLIVWGDSGATNQRWNFTKALSKRERLDALAAQNAQTLPDGSYFVSSAMRGSAVLDVMYGSGADAAPVILWSNHRGVNQIWKVTHDAQGYVTLVNANSGKPLDVEYARAKSGSNVIQYASQGSYNQKWIAVKDGGGIKLISALTGAQDLVLDAYGASSADGTKLIVWADSGAANQRWSFAKAA